MSSKNCWRGFAPMAGKSRLSLSRARYSLSNRASVEDGQKQRHEPASQKGYLTVPWGRPEGVSYAAQDEQLAREAIAWLGQQPPGTSVAKAAHHFSDGILGSAAIRILVRSLKIPFSPF